MRQELVEIRVFAGYAGWAAQPKVVVIHLLGGNYEHLLLRCGTR